MDKNELKVLVPSETVRNYILETGWTFTDMEKAAILSHRDQPMSEVREALTSLRDTTKDGKLKRQLTEYLEREEKAFELFQENTDKDFIYLLTYKKYPDDDNEKLCYFFDYEMAINFGLQLKLPFQIEKHPIISEKTMGRFEARFEGKKFHDFTVGFIRFDENGKIEYFDSEEIPTADDASEDDWYDRFENMYYKVPYPFERGDIIKALYMPTANDDWCGNFDEDIYGIVSVSKQEWDSINGGDYSDVSTRIAFPHDDGFFQHDHINPLYLERYEVPKYPDCTPLDDLLSMTSEVLQGYFSIDDFCYQQAEYAEYNEKRKRNKNHTDEKSDEENKEN